MRSLMTLRRAVIVVAPVLVVGTLLAQRAKDNPNFFITLAATADGKFLPQTGAVLIRDDAGRILGAAGASGGTGEEDEAVCAHGIEQAGLIADASG